MTARTPRTLRVATRRSDLAMAQSRMIGEWLSVLTGRPLEIVEITTHGDVNPAPLSQIGGTGVFVAAVRQALLERRADVAVHSLKDLPTAPDERLYLAAVPRRVDPRDALVARDASTLADLPAGARVGTGSPRRRAQLAAARPDLELVDIRGNVDTRLARVTADLDAVVLAVAGLTRLGRGERITEHLDPDQMLPAPGQGALAVEVHADLRPDPVTGQSPDQPLSLALATLDHADTRAAVRAERALLATLGAGCSAPVGALAEVHEPEVHEPEVHEPEVHEPEVHQGEAASSGLGGSQGPDAQGPDAQGPDGQGPDGQLRTLYLRAVMARPDGVLVHAEASAGLHEAEQLGNRLAGELLADELLADVAQADVAQADVPQADVPRAGTPDPMHSTSPRSIHRGSRQ